MTYNSSDSPIIPILRLLHDSPIFPIIRFFRLLFCHFSDSPNSTRFSDFSDYTILPIVILPFFRFSEYYAILRFFRLYDSSDCYSPIFPNFRVLRDSPIFPIILQIVIVNVNRQWKMNDVHSAKPCAICMYTFK